MEMYFAIFYLGYSAKFRKVPYQLHVQNALPPPNHPFNISLRNHQCNLHVVGNAFIFLTFLRGISRCSVTHLH